MTTQTQPAVTLPKPDGDFYQVTSVLSDAERDTLKRIRTFMESHVAPVVNKYWAEDSSRSRSCRASATSRSLERGTKDMAALAAAHYRRQGDYWHGRLRLDKYMGFSADV
jgi:hypothetical protein